MADIFNSSTTEFGYLLGTLSEQEEIALEQEIFADDARFQELEQAEDELIDAYVQNRLSVDDARQFRKHVLISPRIVARVQFAEALAAKTRSELPLSDEKASATDLAMPPSPYLEESVTPKFSWWRGFFEIPRGYQIALAACLLLILVGGPGLTTGWLRWRNESAQLAEQRAALERQKEELNKRLAEQDSRSKQLTAELEQARAQQAEVERRIAALENTDNVREPNQRTILGTVTFLLSPGAVRSGGTGSKQLAIGSDVATARLNLLLPANDYRRYNVNIKSAERVVFSRKGVTARKLGADTILAISVPAGLLRPNEYTVDVSGVTASGQSEPVENYDFRVLKK